MVAILESMGITHSREFSTFGSLLLFALFSLFLSPLFAATPDVVIITIDTLRADRVGCYGYEKAQTPALDRIATEGILFRDAVAHVPLTRPSHISIFTGLNPYEHNIRDNLAPPLDAKIPTLAEVMRRNGYTTGAFVASFVVNSQSGLQRGFETFAEDFDAQQQSSQLSLELEKRGEQVYLEFKEWQSNVKSRPYFAWIHLYDPHLPYDPPPPFASRFANSPYDGEVAYADETVSKILKLLHPNTLLIVTSDHGESLGEHGEDAHSFFIYDSTLLVPLLIRWPGTLPAGREVQFQTRLIDLFPTVLDLLGIPVAKTISGTSLKPWLLESGSPAPDLFSYCETFIPWLHFGWSRLQGVRSSKWKYIEAPRPELYDLQRDPAELKNRYSREAMPVRHLRKWLHDSGALTAKVSVGTMHDLDAETIEKLASLGYAGVPSAEPRSGDDLPDPKEKIGDFKLFTGMIIQGMEAFRTERYKEAAEKFEFLYSRDVPSFDVNYYLGKSYLQLRSFDKARIQLETAVQKLPHFLPAYKDLSTAWEAQGKLKEAEAALLAGLTVYPHHPSLVHPLSLLYYKNKNYSKAEKVLLEELRNHPDDLDSRFRLGVMYRETKRIDEAVEQFQEIARINPDEPEVHNQLGMLYGATGRSDMSVREFEKAVQLAPHNQSYQHNLSLARSKNNLVRFRIIQVPTREVAEVVYEELRKGENWQALAKEHSIHVSARTADPVLAMDPSDVDPAIAAALAGLQAGNFSPPIETSQGFFLVLRE